MIEELPDELEQDELDDIEPVGDENQLYEHFRVVVDKGQAMVRVDKYLFERIVNASRNRIQKAAEDGFVMANGKPVKSSYKVKPLDVITVMMDRPRYDNEIIPEDIPLNIVYEDKYLMVVNKPAGLVVHPGHGNYHGTLVNAIAWHLKDNSDYDANDPHVGLVHRIDKDTSGLLVIAKTPDAKANLYTSVESITAYERIYEPTSTLDASKATQSFVDMFSEGDLRPIRYFGEKDNEIDYYPIIKTNGSVDYKCSFRVGELYLNSAEAAARLGHLPEARNRLLQLMEKRYNPEKYELKKDEINKMEQEILISEILDERARELAFEGHRWFDLRRTTRPRIEKTLYSGQTIILEQNDERYTLRIPQSAIEANPNLSN